MSQGKRMYDTVCFPIVRMLRCSDTERKSDIAYWWMTRFSMRRSGMNQMAATTKYTAKPNHG